MRKLLINFLDGVPREVVAAELQKSADAIEKLEADFEERAAFIRERHAIELEIAENKGRRKQLEIDHAQFNAHLDKMGAEFGLTKHPAGQHGDARTREGDAP